MRQISNSSSYALTPQARFLKNVLVRFALSVKNLKKYKIDASRVVESDHNLTLESVL
jgi:hypothetical protein